MKRIKIGQGYYQAGYGKGFKKAAAVYLIEGKAYARDTKGLAFQTDLSGYVMLNFSGNYYYEVGLISKHEQHKHHTH